MSFSKYQVTKDIYIKEIDESVSFVIDYIDFPYRPSNLYEPEEGGLDISNICLNDESITKEEKLIVESLLFNNHLDELIQECIENTHESE